MEYKKSLVRLAAAIFCSITLASCGTPPPKYFAKYTPNEDLVPTQGITVFTEQTPPKPPRTMLELGSEAQAALIEKSNKTGPTLAAEFAIPIKAATKPTIKRDKSRVQVSRRLHFALFTENFRPWERLVEAKLTAVPPAGWEFQSWSTAAVERTSISLANVVDTTVKSAGVSSVPFLWGWIPTGGGLDASIQKTRQATRDLAVEVVRFLPSVSAKRLDIRLSAPFPQTSVVGGYRIDVKLAPSRLFFAYVNTLDVKGAAPLIDITHVYFPARVLETDGKRDDLLAGNAFGTAVRRVVSNRKGQLTIGEDDDEVVYEEIELPLVGTLDYEESREPLNLWLVEYGDSKRQNRQPVMLEVITFDGVFRGQSTQCAFFSKIEEATQFANLLDTNGFLSADPKFEYRSGDKKYAFSASIFGVKRPNPTLSIRPIAIQTIEQVEPDLDDRYRPVDLPECFVDEDHQRSR